MILPKSEEQLMKFLWKLEKAFMKDLLNEFPEPKPASTTVSTLLKRLHVKKYLGFNTIGKSREYYPLIAKDDYFSSRLNNFISDFFDDSSSQFVSFFTKKAKFSEIELRELKEMIDEELKNK
ncbi:MAG: penicillinase repressor [Flavobacteriaceae bacterium]|nr:MAG: penicillinase repressor [Flavobacteriaceae bacterium]